MNDRQPVRPDPAHAATDHNRAKTSMGDYSPKSMIAAFAVPWIMVLAILGAAIGGVFLDRWLNTSPWMAIILIVLGVIGGGIQAYRWITKALRGK